MAAERLIYPLGRQDFESLREDGCVYVDKTELVYDLVKYNKYVFLSRPRRFGKSLLLSTVRYYLEGRKDLFEGLKIMELEKKWTKHPVLHLSLGAIDSSDKEGLSSSLERQFKNWELKYDVTVKEKTLSDRFARIISNASAKTGERVIVLIDEYDNPLINTIHNPEIYEMNRTLLKSVYSNLKDLDNYIKFAMITGVSRFSNTSVFSGLNNITDISFHSEYASICGFTKEEITEYLWTGIERYALKNDTGTQETLEELKREYDGYHFTEDLVDIYNPYSLLNCLNQSKIDNYWMQSGVPEFLVRKLKNNSISFTELFSAQATPATLSTIDAAFDSPIALFYQTGYLTIKGYDKQKKKFQLGIPNKEINEGLTYFLLKSYLFSEDMVFSNRLEEMASCIRKGNPQEFIETLETLLAPIGYHLHGKMTEVDFERTMFVIFHMLGFHMHSQLTTSFGRIDLTVETKDFVYLIEIKLDGSAQDALDQINRKDYALQWKHSERKVFKIGISFSSAKRNIDSFLISE